MARLLSLLAILLAACAQTPQPERRAPAAEPDRAYLAAAYGCRPREGSRERRDLDDLLRKQEFLAGLRRPQVRALATDLAALAGYRFRPRDAAALVAAPEGPAGAAVADPAIRAFLSTLRERGFLDPEAGRGILTMTREGLDALRELAADPGAADRIGRLARLFDYGFRPADASPLRAAGDLPPGDATWLAGLLRGLRAGFRPGWRPELAVLAAHREEVEDLLRLAEAGGVRLRGPGAVLVLARLAPEHRPLSAEELRRFRDLAGRTSSPGARDLLSLVPLARAPGVPAVVDELRRRWRYRFDPADGPALLSLASQGIPDPRLPDWVVRDRVPLTHPEDLLSSAPACAFADRNDLLFLEALQESRPELCGRSRDYLTRRIRGALARLPRQNRPGAPYDEYGDRLGDFLRPDLLKAILLLEELARPSVRARLAEWLERDVADRDREYGGYVRLTPGGRLRFELKSAPAEGNERLWLPPDPEGAALDFHFHASDADESAYAGPSSGGPGTDLFRAARHRVDGLVITKMCGRRFNIDLYLSTKKVLDLGVREP